MYNQSCPKLFNSSGSSKQGEAWTGECSDAIKDYATPLNITADTCSSANDSQKALNITTTGGNTLGGRPVPPEAPDAAITSVAAQNSTASGSSAGDASGGAGGGVDVGMVAGVAAGGLAALSAVIIAVRCLCRRRAEAATSRSQAHIRSRANSRHGGSYRHPSRQLQRTNAFHHHQGGSPYCDTRRDYQFYQRLFVN